MCAFGIVLSIIGPLLIDISKSYSLSMSLTGLLFSVNFFGFITFIFIGGMLAERFGKKNIITIALLGLSVSLFIFGFSHNVIFAFVSIFLIGGFGGIIESIVSSLVSDLNDTNADYYINLSQIFLCIGAALGPILALLMTVTGNTWRMAYFILSSIMIILFLIIISIKIDEKPIANKININEFKTALLDKKFVLVLIGFVLYAGTEVGVWGWMSTFMVKDMNLTQSVSAILVSVFWISMMIGRVICGKLIKYFKVQNFIIVLSLFSAVVVFLSGLIKGGILTWIIVIAIGFAFSSLYPFLLSVGSTERSNATAFALMVGSGGVGTILIPFFMGTIGEHMGTNIAMMSPSLLMLLLAGMFIINKFTKSGKNYGNNSNM